jgi:hypothetical protein
MGRRSLVAPTPLSTPDRPSPACRHRADDTVSKAIHKILHADIVVDDIGLLPVGTDATEGLYRLVDAAYEKRSVAVSSNLHPAGFDELMPETLATATGRPAPPPCTSPPNHRDSIRMSQALARKGVTALTLAPGPR